MLRMTSLALLVLPFVPASSADHPCEPSSFPARLDTGDTLPSRYYLIQTPLLTPLSEITQIYLVEETNGVDGAQPAMKFWDLTCGQFPPDATLAEVWV